MRAEIENSQLRAQMSLTHLYHLQTQVSTGSEWPCSRLQFVAYLDLSIQCVALFIFLIPAPKHVNIGQCVIRF